MFRLSSQTHLKPKLSDFGVERLITYLLLCNNAVIKDSVNV